MLLDEAACEALLAANPDHPGVARRLGEIRFHRGELEPAIEAFTRAVTTDPADHKAWHMRAFCHRRLAQSQPHFLVVDGGTTEHRGAGVHLFEKSIADSTRALAICERGEYYGMRAACLMVVGREAQAFADADRAVALGDRLTAVWLDAILQRHGGRRPPPRS